MEGSRNRSITTRVTSPGNTVFSITVLNPNTNRNLTVKDHSTVTLTFKELLLSDAGIYTYHVTIRNKNNAITTITTTFNVIGNSIKFCLTSTSVFYAVHPVTLKVSLNNAGSSVLAGTERSMLCSFVDQTAEIRALNLNFSRLEEAWYRWDVEMIRRYDVVKDNGTRVITSNMAFSHLVQFKPIMTSDGGQYVCRTEDRKSKQNLYGLIHLDVTSEYNCIRQK